MVSQPVIGKMPTGNLLTSAAILFRGQTYTYISQFASFFNLKFIFHTTIHNIQRQFVMPVVMHTWSVSSPRPDLDEDQREWKMPASGWCGRCDIPGFSAKYCAYSLLDMNTDAVVTFVFVQISETGSSSRMEAEAFCLCMSYLLDLGFTIQVLATDSHVQIRNIIKKEFPSTDHQFDVWHLYNNIKKLVQRAKAKGWEDLGLWVKAICNHLWWRTSSWAPSWENMF